MQQRDMALDANHFVQQSPLSVLSAGLWHNCIATAHEICGILDFSVSHRTSRESRSFGDYLTAWFSQSSSYAQDVLTQAKVGVTKIFTRKEIYNFTEQEVCDSLDRAIHLISTGTEDQFLSDRLEPWIGLARPMSHNVATRIYYWPEEAL